MRQEYSITIKGGVGGPAGTAITVPPFEVEGNAAPLFFIMH